MIQSQSSNKEDNLMSSKMTSEQKVVLGSTTLGFTLDHMDATFLSFALAPMIAELHITGAQGGIIAAMSNWGALLGSVLFGILADRIGRVRVLSYTVMLVTFATVILAFLDNAHTIYASRFLLGMGTGGEYGVSMALIAESFRANRVGRMSSITAIGGQVGAILAAILATLIMPAFGWRGLFMIGFLPLIVVYIVRRHLKETPAFEQLKSDYKSGRKKFSFKFIANTPKRAYTSLVLIIMLTIQTSGYYGLMNWLPTIMRKQLGITATVTAGYVNLGMIPIIMGMAVGMMTFGTILDRIGPRQAFAIFLIGSAIMIYTFTFAYNMWTLTILGAIVGFFSNGMYGGFGAVISRLYPAEIRATAANTLMGSGRALGAFSSVVIGWIMDNYDVATVMLSLTVMYLISLAFMLTIPDFKKLGANSQYQETN
ncbi:MAG: MFS transporter [Leuconostoc gelidum]|uniref:MFS transporter n=1 Tax=Leuconostoc gelidum subsp. gelidum TaxID=1607839 RepID=A0AB35G0L7_LEUGE|nr:MFS transporter [Leuconostoc gelidum]MBZ5963922.1 MFS transporter [Leuconostoc gelidum subsp. gelidum]MBZ5975234.1 MFS transporter [Leuconostoc gelidum subsp. gelidum]MBZ5976595.1 MFS transporter [Leuconostoc gelidum subsp. gelidum]MBZ5978690.1 MFS transporter [Leuconostoc gelidum subsp. gelidum]MBZ5985607.1 MFS transporter [Leuconostoc gelidum subsp. gelidum]